MLDAYAQYDSGHPADDIDWMTWLAFKQLTDLFKTCGNNCNRNDTAGIFNSGWTDTHRAALHRGLPGLEPLRFRWSDHEPVGGAPGPLHQRGTTQNAKQHTVWLQRTTCANRFN